MTLRDTLDNLRPKPKVKAVEMPDWGTTVYVRKLSWAQLDAIKSADDPVLSQVQMCLCDEQGNLLYQEHERHLLGKFHLDELEKIIDEASRFNSLAARVEQAKNV